MPGHTCLDILRHFLDRNGAGLFQDDAGHDLLAVLLIRHADDLDIPDRRVGINKFFDLLGVDILAAPDDHVFQTAGDPVSTVCITAGKVAGMEPAFCIHGIPGGFRHFIRALHGVVAPGAELAVDTVGDFLPGLRVDDLAFHMGEIIAHGIGPQIQGIRPGGHGGAGGRLGLAIDTDDAPHIHLIGLGRPAHQLRRAARAGHNTGAHMGEVGLPVVRVIEHGDKHGGNAVEAGDPLLVDAGQGGFCGEIRQGAKGCAVGHGGGHGEHHAEAVEHGHLDHHPVRRRQSHPVTDALAVIDHIVVG